MCARARVCTPVSVGESFFVRMLCLFVYIYAQKWVSAGCMCVYKGVLGFFFSFSFFCALQSLTPGSGAWLIDMLLGPQCAIETDFFFFFLLSCTKCCKQTCMERR